MKNKSEGFFMWTYKIVKKTTLEPLSSNMQESNLLYESFTLGQKVHF